MKLMLSSGQFWISNISNMDVSLDDLGVTVKRGKTVNLLDRRRFDLTIEQITASQTDGSLFAKRSRVPVRKVPPAIDDLTKTSMIEIDYNATVPSRRRSVVQVEDAYYEELEISDDDFAAQAADMIDRK